MEYHSSSSFHPGNTSPEAEVWFAQIVLHQKPHPHLGKALLLRQPITHHHNQHHHNQPTATSFHNNQQLQHVLRGQYKNQQGFFIKIPGRPSPANLMISCFGGGAPEVTNNVLGGDLDQTHVELHKEAAKASGITIAVGVAILFLGCWYYHYRWAMRDSAGVRAHRARRRNPFNFANPFTSHSAPPMHMVPMAQAPPTVQLPCAPPMYSHPQWLTSWRYNACRTPRAVQNMVRTSFQRNQARNDSDNIPLHKIKPLALDDFGDDSITKLFMIPSLNVITGGRCQPTSLSSRVYSTTLYSRSYSYTHAPVHTHLQR